MIRLMACLTIIAMVLAPVLAQEECVVVVGLHWPEHDLSHAQVRVFRDKERRDLVAAFPADASGKVLMAVAPGTYYLTAVVDLDNDGKLNAGDGLGFYGVEDPNAQQPQPLEIKAPASGILLPISLVMDKDGKLAATGVRLRSAEPPPPVKQCHISGRLTGGSGQPRVVYLVAGDGSSSHAALPAADGSFSLIFPAGEYFVFAAEDTNDTEGLDPGDLFAVHGYRAELARQFPTVQLQQDVTDLQMTLQWRISDSGLLTSLDGAVAGPQVALQTLPAVLLGSVTGDDAPASGVASAGGDARFSGAAVAAPISGGRFVLSVPAGVYYLSAMMGAEPGSKPAPGDLMGFYGVSDVRKAHGPQPVALRPGEIRDLSIALTAELDEQLRPVPLKNEPGQPQ